MTYTKPLPPIRELLNVARQIRFPAPGKEVVKTAREQGASEIVTDFLCLFPADETFKSRVDFMTRTEELEMLIEQERSTPAETLRSPQE